METWAEIGQLTIIAALLVDRVLMLLRDRGIDLAEHGRRLQAIQKQLQEIADDLKQIKAENHDLHQWHDARDSDGVFVWHFRQSLMDQIRRLAQAVEENSAIMRQFATLAFNRRPPCE